MSSLETVSGDNNFYQAFHACSNLTNVDLSSLKTVSGQDIFKQTFYNCSSLETFEVPNLTTITNVSTTSTLGTFDDTFYGCTNLTSIDMSGVTTINGGYCLTKLCTNCPNLTSIDLSSLTTIEGDGVMVNMITNCPNLASLDLSSLTTMTGKNIFSNALKGTAIKTFSVPNLTSIPQNGFTGTFNGQSGASQIEVFNAPNVTSVGVTGLNGAVRDNASFKKAYLNKLSYSDTNGLNYMFYNCTGLELVDFSDATAVPALSSTTTFQNTNNTYKIVVPDALYSTWIAATNWSNSSIKPHIVRKSDYYPAQ